MASAIRQFQFSSFTWNDLFHESTCIIILTIVQFSQLHTNKCENRKFSSLKLSNSQLERQRTNQAFIRLTLWLQCRGVVQIHLDYIFDKCFELFSISLT